MGLVISITVSILPEITIAGAMRFRAGSQLCNITQSRITAFTKILVLRQEMKSFILTTKMLLCSVLEHYAQGQPAMTSTQSIGSLNIKWVLE